MNDVLINGVRYVPETNKPNNHHVKRLSSVLAKECPYLSRTVRDKIVRKFELSDVETSNSKNKSKPKKNATPHSSKRLFSIKNIKGIDEEGHVLFKRGRRLTSEWTIYHATEIRQWMSHGKFDKNRVNKLSEKLGLSTDIIHKLMYNLENDEFNTWLDIMVSKNQVQSEEKPKKEDMGWF